VRALGVVESEVLTETDPGFPAILIRLQIDLFILHRPPQPLDEQVVGVAPLAVHANLDSMLLQQPGERLRGELAALVGVEGLGPALPERLFESLDAETGVQGV